jgi:hypothetical protein
MLQVGETGIRQTDRQIDIGVLAAIKMLSYNS